MSVVKGRRWPDYLPFSGTIRGKDGNPATFNDFYCELRPGDFQWQDDGAPPGERAPAAAAAADDLRLAFACPKEPGRLCTGGSGIIVGLTKPACKPSWAWDGNADRPTLTPSIDCKACGWHGWLQSGEFRPC